MIKDSNSDIRWTHTRHYCNWKIFLLLCLVGALMAFGYNKHKVIAWEDAILDNTVPGMLGLNKNETEEAKLVYLLRKAVRENMKTDRAMYNYHSTTEESDLLGKRKLVLVYHLDGDIIADEAYAQLSKLIVRETSEALYDEVFTFGCNIVSVMRGMDNRYIVIEGESESDEVLLALGAIIKNCISEIERKVGTSNEISFHLLEENILIIDKEGEIVRNEIDYDIDVDFTEITKMMESSISFEQKQYVDYLEKSQKDNFDVREMIMSERSTIMIGILSMGTVYCFFVWILASFGYVRKGRHNDENFND